VQHVDQIKDDSHIICLFRIKSTNATILTLGHLQQLNKDDQDFFINYILNILAIKSVEYKEAIIS